MEDVVAVVMLTILASQSQGGEDANVGSLLATMSAFVEGDIERRLRLHPSTRRSGEAIADGSMA